MSHSDMAAHNQQEGDLKTQPATPHLSSLTTTSRTVILPALARILGLSIAMIVKTPATAGVDNTSK